MNIDEILTALRAERSRIDAAIAALAPLGGGQPRAGYIARAKTEGGQRRHA